jgi:hypothetical protein
MAAPWLTVAGQRVDLLYSRVGQGAGVIESCHASRIEKVYTSRAIRWDSCRRLYMGEVALAQVLWDPDGVLAALKRRCYALSRRPWARR